MKKIFLTIALSLCLMMSGAAFAGGQNTEQNHGDKGQGETNDGADSQGAGTQQRSGR